jgi:hypothetical protein
MLTPFLPDRAVSSPGIVAVERFAWALFPESSEANKRGMICLQTLSVGKS